MGGIAFRAPASPKALSGRGLLEGSGGCSLPALGTWACLSTEVQEPQRISAGRFRSRALRWRWLHRAGRTLPILTGLPRVGVGWSHAGRFLRQAAQGGRDLSTVRNCVRAERARTGIQGSPLPVQILQVCHLPQVLRSCSPRPEAPQGRPGSPVRRSLGLLAGTAARAGKGLPV